MEHRRELTGVENFEISHDNCRFYLYYSADRYKTSNS